MNWTSKEATWSEEKAMDVDPIAAHMLAVAIEHWLKSPEEKKRLRRNRNNRERYQAMRDLGLKKTPYGWE